MLQQLLTIGRNTFTESIRQPIYVVLILLGILGLIFNSMLAAYTLDDDTKLMIGLGLSVLLIIGMLLSAFTATSVLSAELENKTVLTVISKPVTRPLFVLGKFAGVAAAIAVAYWILMMVFLLLTRQGVLQDAAEHVDGPVITFGLVAIFLAFAVATAGNFLYRWVFASTLVTALTVFLALAWLGVLLVGHEWQFQSITTEFIIPDDPHKHVNLPQVLIALLLVFEGVTVLVAIAIATSTRLRQLMTLVVTIAITLLGMLNDSLFSPWIRSHGWDTVQNFADACKLTAAQIFRGLAPNLQIFWVADAIKQSHDVPLAVVATVTSYSILYILAVLLVAIALFQTREVG